MGDSSIQKRATKPDPLKIEIIKEILKELCEDGAYISDRRRILRLRAGLSDEDRHKVPKFKFVILDSKLEIGERQAESDFNFALALELCAAFAEDPPSKREFEVALTWVSCNYRLNPWKEHYQHEAWAAVEAGAVKGLLSYCLNRFQRNRGVRPGHPRAEQLKAVIRQRLKDANMLTPEGKKTPTRGRGMSKQKRKDLPKKPEEKKMAPAQNPDQADTLPMPDSMGTPSPVHPMRSLTFSSPEGLQNSDSTYSVRGKRRIGNTKMGKKKTHETAEEEGKTEDECVDAEGFGCDETIELLSDDDVCLMSPPKKGEGLNEHSAPSAQTAGEPSQKPAQSQKVEDGSGSVVAEPKKKKHKKRPAVPAETPADSQAVFEQPPDSQDQSEPFAVFGQPPDSQDRLEPSAVFEQPADSQTGVPESNDVDPPAEETLNSANEGEPDNRTAFKDRKPLIAKIPEMPADLQQQVEAAQDTAQTPEEEEAKAEIRKAQPAMRRMAREAEREAEDPDRMWQEEEDSDGKPKRGRGRGRGKGRGRGRSGKGGRGRGRSKVTPDPSLENHPKETPDQTSETNPGTKSPVKVPDKPSHASPSKPPSPRLHRTKSKRRALLQKVSPKSKAKKLKRKRSTEDAESEKTKQPKTDKSADKDEAHTGKEGQDAQSSRDGANEAKEVEPGDVETTKPPEQKPPPQKSPEQQQKQDEARQNNFDLLARVGDDKLSASLPTFEDLQGQKSFTLSPPDMEGKEPPAVKIQVLLCQSRSVSGAFYISCPPEGTLEDLKKHKHIELKANKQDGVSVGWGKYGGPVFAWTVAKIVAGWEPASLSV